MQVRDPASRSWSAARLSGAHGPAGARSAAVRKDLSLHLSAVHENIRGRASRRFRNWFRVQASGSIGPICFSWGTASPHPFIVHDESSRVFLGGALQRSPPLRRPLQSWCSFRVRSTGKTSQASPSGGYCRRQNRQKCGRFIPALTLRRKVQRLLNARTGVIEDR